MKLRRIEITHFRGIESLTWDPKPGFNLLIGPGDSGKTTILDAIDYVLGPRWSLAFGDADFTNCDTTKRIEITATIGDLPKRLMGDARFESHYRGWREGELHDEPTDDEVATDEPVLSIRLTVTSDLEPTWVIWTDREVENRPSVRLRDREILGLVRVGAYIDRHLTWGRGSALQQYSGDIDDLGAIFALSRREAADSFGKQSLPLLREAADKLGKEAKNMGVRITGDLQPGLEMASLQSSSAVIGLFDGKVPTRQMGLGSRRLLTATMQLERAADKSLLLVDELESALEPHRIRKLVRTLSRTSIQVVASTHSPIALQESCDQNVCYVSSADGIPTVTPFDALITKNLKKSPYAGFATKVIVCEGLTEQGFLDACRQQWEEMSKADLDSLGVAEAYGEGSPNSGKLAVSYASMGVPTAFYGDNDRGVGFTDETARKVKLETFQYRTGWNSERAFFASLSEAQIAEFIDLLAQNPSFPYLRQVLAQYFEMPPDGQLWQPNMKCLPAFSSTAEALANAANGRPRDKASGEALWWKEWLKDREFAGKALRPVIADWAVFSQTELGRVLEPLRIWCYGK